MSDSDLMFRSAGELAGMVRAGEVSAKELVALSLERIEELNPRLNAFVEVDGERALAAAEQVRAGDGRPFAGVPVAIKNNRPVSGLRLTYGCSLMEAHVGRLRPQRHAAPKGCGVHRGGYDDAAGVRDPAGERGARVRPDAQPVGSRRARRAAPRAVRRRRWPAGWCRSRTATTAVARSAFQLRCCGLVGLKPQRGRISAAPELGESLLGIDGMLTRTVADTAAILDVLAGV